MPVYNIAVMLWQWGAPVSLHDKAWYEDYFFNPFYGQAGFWLKQSDGSVVLSGRVFDWLFDSAPARDFSNRTNTAKAAIEILEGDVGLSPYQSIVVVLGIPKEKPADGGSSQPVASSFAMHHTLVTRIGDPFDFISHELGHGILGRPHSFTWDENYQAIGESPGGYGHRHCIMSAEAYGGNEKEARHDAPPPLGWQDEYHYVGPSLNGVTAQARGWINCYEVALTPGFKSDFVIRSRQWMGHDPALPPQGIHISKPGGPTYVVEFYENQGWDIGLTRPHLIITQDTGGLADTHYPGAHSGTYLDSMGLPGAALAGHAAVLNVSGPLGVIPLAYDPASHTLRVEINDHIVSGGVIAMATKVETEPHTVGSDRVTFEPGDRFCVSGEWTFDWTENQQTATIDASHPRAGSGASWTVDDVPLPPDKAILPLNKTVMVADPKLLDGTKSLAVEIGYKIEPIPNGSRLTLTNRPEDESYSVEVAVTLTNSVASGTETRTIEFSGRECVFPPEFYERYSGCLSSFAKKALHDSQSVVTLDPGSIPKGPHPEFEGELVGWLGGLAHSFDHGDHVTFDLATATLKRRLLLPNARFSVMERRDALQVPRDEGEIPPAASPRSLLETDDA